MDDVEPGCSKTIDDQNDNENTEVTEDDISILSKKKSKKSK